MKALEFNGSGSEYFKIWIVNILLTIVTLGLYYPWAKVRNNRYFYANTTLDGRNFEYHAVGKQLFIGYLIAMSLLITYVVIQKIFPMGSLILLALLFLAIPWVIVRSMMFNMRMTSFSNVRFEFTGKLKNAYINFFAYPLALYIGFIALYLILIKGMSMGGFVSGVLAIVLFVALPAFMLYGLAFIKKKNTEYFINNINYGQGVFRTNLEIKNLVSIALQVVVIALVAFAITLFTVGLISYLSVGLESLLGLSNVGQDPAVLKHKMSTIIPIITAIYGGMIFSMIFVTAYSLTKHRAYIYANTILDENISFESTLKALPFAWVLISNLLMIIFTLGLATPWAKVRTAKIMSENTLVKANDGFDDYISQKQTQTSSLGEQIGDAFDVDVGAGVGIGL